jgi:holo-ACP synthase
MFTLREVTLEEMLLARERRVVKQKEMLTTYLVPLISYQVNIPGPLKRTPLSIRIFDEGLQALNRAMVTEHLTPIVKQIQYPVTGPEAIIAVSCVAAALKRIVTRIEDDHSLGRLFDLDVIGLDGKALSREMLGMSRRKCFLCAEDAYVCGRSRRHSVDDLTLKIQAMAREYFKNKD